MNIIRRLIDLVLHPKAELDKEWAKLMRAVETDEPEDWIITAGWGGRNPASWLLPDDCPKEQQAVERNKILAKDKAIALVKRWDRWVNSMPHVERSRYQATRRLLDALTVDEMVRAIEDGADVNVYSGNYKYPRLINEAACVGNAEIAKVLIDAGADLELGSKYCTATAFSAATFQHQYEVAHMLLEAGASPNHADCDMFNILSEIADSPWFESRQKELELFRAMILAGGVVCDEMLEHEGKEISYDSDWPAIKTTIRQWRSERVAKELREQTPEATGQVGRVRL